MSVALQDMSPYARSIVERLDWKPTPRAAGTRVTGNPRTRMSLKPTAIVTDLLPAARGRCQRLA